MKRLRSLILATLTLNLASCVTEFYASALKVSSDPPGARVLIDGADTGFVTPTMIEVDNRARLDLELPGYETATRQIRSDSQLWVAHWDEMSLSPGNWRFPLWLNIVDAVPPVKLHSGPSPSRVFVRMKLAGGE